MRYYLILLTLWAFFALNAFSQSPEDRGLTISGTIQDAELKEPHRIRHSRSFLYPGADKRYL